MDSGPFRRASRPDDYLPSISYIRTLIVCGYFFFLLFPCIFMNLVGGLWEKKKEKVYAYVVF